MSVSVIIPSHNYGRFLPQAIESVLAQLGPWQELIVVDDGSTDDSFEIAKSYQDWRIRVLSITNRDMANALNAGLIALDPVDWVITLNADDWLEPNYVYEMTKHDGDAVVAAIKKHPGGGPELPGVLHPSAEQLWEWCHTNSCAMFKYQSLVEMGGFHGLMSGDYDWDIWIDMALRGMKVSYCDTTFYNYRVHADSYTNTVATRRQFGHKLEMWRHHRLHDHDGFAYPVKEYPSEFEIANAENDRVDAHLERLWNRQPASS